MKQKKKKKKERIVWKQKKKKAETIRGKKGSGIARSRLTSERVMRVNKSKTEKKTI